MEMASTETIKQAVMAGMGLSFLSLHTLGLELDNRLIAVLDVQGAPVVRAWNVVHMLSKLLSPAAEAFRYFVLEHGEDYLAQQFGRHVNLGSINSGLIPPASAQVRAMGEASGDEEKRHARPTARRQCAAQRQHQTGPRNNS
jgi:hypothetical protein